MKMELLRLAKVDLGVCKMTLEVDADELYVNMAAFHLQQAVENTLKYLLSRNGSKYPFTHDIGDLIIACDEDDIFYPEWLMLNAEYITSLENKFGYRAGVLASKKRVGNLIDLAEAWISSIDDTIPQELSNLKSRIFDTDS